MENTARHSDCHTGGKTEDTARHSDCHTGGKKEDSTRHSDCHTRGEVDHVVGYSDYPYQHHTFFLLCLPIKGLMDETFLSLAESSVSPFVSPLSTY